MGILVQGVKESWLFDKMFAHGKQGMEFRSLTFLAYAFISPFDCLANGRLSRRHSAQQREGIVMQIADLESSAIDAYDKAQEGTPAKRYYDRLSDELHYLQLGMKKRDVGQVLEACTSLSLLEGLRKEQGIKNVTVSLGGIQYTKTCAPQLTDESLKFMRQSEKSSVFTRLRAAVARYVMVPLGLIYGITIGPIVNIIGKAIARPNERSEKFGDVNYYNELAKFSCGVAIAAPIVACGLVYGFSAVGAALQTVGAALQTGALVVLTPVTLLAKVVGLGAVLGSIGFPPLAIAVCVVAALYAGWKILKWAGSHIQSFCQKHRWHRSSKSIEREMAKDMPKKEVKEVAESQVGLGTTATTVGRLGGVGAQPVTAPDFAPPSAPPTAPAAPVVVVPEPKVGANGGLVATSESMLKQ